MTSSIHVKNLTKLQMMMMRITYDKENTTEGIQEIFKQEVSELSISMP